MITQTLNAEFHPISIHLEIGANASASRIIHKLCFHQGVKFELHTRL